VKAIEPHLPNKPRGVPRVDDRRVLNGIFAPLKFYEGRRGRIKSRMRSAISPWVDMRNELDVIRDRLEMRGVALLEAA
jgi:hypothetical protein